MGIPIRPAVRISRFFANSPAEKSGLQLGDIILEFNGQPVKTAADIQRLVEQTPAGSVGKITIYRKGGQPSPLMMVQVKVASMPDDFLKRAASGFDGEDIQVFQSEELGFSAIDLHQQLAGQINLTPNTGIYIMDVSQNSPAMRAGLRKGIVIQACNGIKTWTVNEFVAALERADINRGVMLTILVNGRPTSVLLRR